jgi:hypothetical protein
VKGTWPMLLQGGPQEVSGRGADAWCGWVVCLCQKRDLVLGLGVGLRVWGLGVRVQIRKLLLSSLQRWNSTNTDLDDPNKAARVARFLQQF